MKQSTLDANNTHTLYILQRWFKPICSNFVSRLLSISHLPSSSILTYKYVYVCVYVLKKTKPKKGRQGNACDLTRAPSRIINGFANCATYCFVYRFNSEQGQVEKKKYMKNFHLVNIPKQQWQQQQKWQ